MCFVSCGSKGFPERIVARFKSDNGCLFSTGNELYGCLVNDCIICYINTVTDKVDVVQVNFGIAAQVRNDQRCSGKFAARLVDISLADIDGNRFDFIV